MPMMILGVVWSFYFTPVEFSIMSQQRRGSMHGGNSVTNHGSSNNLHITSHEIQNHGIPLPGMVPTRSILGNSVLGNPIHGFVNPLGPMGPSHSPPTHSSGMIGMSHHPSSMYPGREFHFVWEEHSLSLLLFSFRFFLFLSLSFNLPLVQLRNTFSRVSI